jgi:nitroreductase
MIFLNVIKSISAKPRKWMKDLQIFFHSCVSDIKYLYFLNKKCNDPMILLSLLCRNCHVLEKGIYLDNFEKGHSINRYEEIKKIISGMNDDFKDDPSFLWCLHVINIYEEMQKNENFKPPNTEIFDFSNSTENIFNFMKSSISCRDFESSNINEDELLKVIDVASLAPNSCNRQGTRIYYIKSINIINNLLPNIAGATGFSHGIPNLFCITSDIRTYEMVDRYLPFIDASLFTQNLVLALKALGYSSTLLNIQHATNEEIKKIKNILSIPKYENIISFLAFGYAKKLPEKPSRMNINLILKNNF